MGRHFREGAARLHPAGGGRGLKQAGPAGILQLAEHRVPINAIAVTTPLGQRYPGRRKTKQSLNSDRI